MQKPGCQVLVTVLSMLFAVFFLIGGMQCNRMMQNQQKEEQAGGKVATIGDFVIFDQPVRESAQGQFNPVSATVNDVVRAYGSAIDQDVTQGLLLALAKQEGIGLDDDSILKAASKEIDDRMGMIKQMMIAQKQLPPNATDQQFEEKMKAQSGGKSIAETKQAELDGLKAALQDPVKHNTVLGQLANSIVVEGLKNKLDITDEQLRHSEDNYVFKRIFLAASKHPGKDVSQLAQQILADLKSRKMTFEQAMDKYTDDPSGKGRPPHDNTNEVQMNTMQTDPEHMPLRDLKVGDISDVLPASGLASGVGKGVAIWRLDSIIPGNIPDFQKQKPSLLMNYSETLAAAQLQAGLKQERSAGAIKWQSPGWQLLDDWYQTTLQGADFANSSIDEQKKIEQEYLSKALNLNFADTGALMTQMGTIEFLWKTATPAEKQKLANNYYLTLNQFNQQNAIYESEIALANLAIQKKDANTLSSALAQAAALNEAGVSTPEGQKNFEDLNALLLKVEGMKILNADQIKTVQSALDTWKADRRDYDKQMAEQAKEAAEERAKVDAERKKAAAAKKAPTPIIAKPTPAGAKTAPAPTLGKATAAPGGTATINTGAPPQPATTGGK